jgi:hypothetical protein
MLALYPLPNGGLFYNATCRHLQLCRPANTPENFGVARIDWNISDKDALFGRYQADFGNRTTNAGLGLWPTMTSYP